MNTCFDWFGWGGTIVRVDMVAAFALRQDLVVATGPTGDQVAVWGFYDEHEARAEFGALQAELRRIAERRGETKVDDNDC